VDGLGSTRALTDINGLLTDAYAYEVFGKIIKQLGNTQNSYLFAGEQRDPNLGLDYLRARYLDVNSGRFYGRDLFRGFYKNPTTLNKFIYANSNPVNIIDPSGKFGLTDFAIGFSIGFGLGLGAAYFPSSLFNDEEGDTSIGPQYDKEHFLYHKYYLETRVDIANDPSLLDIAFKALKRYPAPGADGSREVQSGDRTNASPFGIAFGSVVHQVLDGNHTVINITEPNHLLHEGKVIRRVKQKSDGIYIETTGDGIGSFPALNVVLSKPAWRLVDYDIYLLMIGLEL
jgi:RHS repeat-associated protein